MSFAADGVAEPVCLYPDQLCELICQQKCHTSNDIDAQAWVTSGYMPTPTIVEVARALYQSHTVEEIARSDSGARNLNQTTNRLTAITDRAKAEHRKAICFVTGVPGAGKTLAGLNIATQRARAHGDENAAFLSGNDPLVTVLREALARDEAERLKTAKAAALRKVKSFIQNIHHFRDDALSQTGAPPEKVVVFDEAQCAWTRKQTSSFMQAKRGYPEFDMSEPEFLLSVMDRHEDWCVVICLVGGGQEINTGEAGLGEWLSAPEERFPHWDVYISDQLEEGGYVIGATAQQLLHELPVNRSHDLHLAVSMRSFRAEDLLNFIGHILDTQPEAACEIYGDIAAQYPIWLVRDLKAARRWLRGVARGSERFGLVASSGAYRLRPEGLQVKAKVDVAIWFLNGHNDVRSSFYLEEVATEFGVQGLELDWAGVCWDADLRYGDGRWSYHRFRGTSWQRINQEERQLYLKNSYRVILTRARQRMVIFVPEGEAGDPTRSPEFYNQTANYLAACGIPELPEPGKA